MKLGLTLGKFAPLHDGHCHLIRTALQEMDQLIVLIYDCPDLDTPPLPVRANWIRQLFPRVEVQEAWDGPTQTGLSPEITRLHDEYLRSRFAGRRITHFYSSEAYGQHVSQALNCIDRQVDPARSHVPVSATLLRDSLFEHRHYLDPLVWCDLVTKVVFLGAPSTGKTTLAQELARRLSTTWMPEYGREYWEQHQCDRRLTEKQLLEIAVEHRCREEALIRDANRYFFVDTDASTTLQFSYYYHERAEQELIAMAHQARTRYDLFFLCQTDIPYDDSWDRSGEVSRQIMQRRIEADLLTRKIPFHRVAGDLASRCRFVERILSEYHPWR